MIRTSFRLKVLGVALLLATSTGLNSPAAKAAEPFEVAATIGVTYSSDIAVSGEYAYVASNTTISVLDARMGSVIRTIPTGGITSPRGVAASGDRVFIAAAGSDELLTLNVSSSTVSRVLTNTGGTGCSSPSNLLVVSANRLVANCQGNHRIQVYDISGATSILATYATGQDPRLMSSSGDVVFVPNHGESTMSVINIATGATTTVNVGSNPNATAYLDGKVYTADFNGDTSTISDGANFNRRVAQVAVGSNPQDIAPCQGKIFTANRWTGNTSVISPTTNTVINTVNLAGVGAITHVMGVRDKYAYFLNFISKSVSVVDCVSETLAATVSVADNPNWIAFSDTHAYVTLSGDKVAAIVLPRDSSGLNSSATGTTTTTETIALAGADGVVCHNTSVRGTQGTWVTLPGSDRCQVDGQVGRRLLGWSTSEDFPVEIARRQVDRGWGAYELFNADGRMTSVFIPAGGATFLSGSTTLYPILSP